METEEQGNEFNAPLLFANMNNNDNDNMSFQFVQERPDGPLIDINIPDVISSKTKITIKDTGNELSNKLIQEMKTFRTFLSDYQETLNNNINNNDLNSDKFTCIAVSTTFLLLVSIALLVVSIILISTR